MMTSMILDAWGYESWQIRRFGVTSRPCEVSLKRTWESNAAMDEIPVSPENLGYE